MAVFSQIYHHEQIIFQDVYEMTVYVGCRPSVQLQFDWELLADKTARGFHDCDDPKERQPCIDHSASRFTMQLMFTMQLSAKVIFKQNDNVVLIYRCANFLTTNGLCHEPRQ